ncbi:MULTISPECIES: minor capsid protein [Gammaproteobacteria]|uniref:minor capsid protein n=1 Tax=Acinetobacter sp. HRXRD-152 TaxID=3404808 RepID=UPI003BB7DBBA
MTEYSPGMSNTQYWINRSIEIEKAMWKRGDKAEKELDKILKKAFFEITRDTDAFLHRYATDNNLTLQQAEQLLSPIELSDYRSRMNELLKMGKETNNPFAMVEIQKLAAQSKINRLQALLNEIDMQLNMLSINQQMVMEEFLTDVTTESYYKTVYNAQRFANSMGSAFAKINKEAVMKVITYPWSGSMFSERIWSNKRKLITAIKETLTLGLVRGTSTQEMTRQLRDKLNVSYFNANRIIRTEANYVMNEGHAKGYEAVGVEQYQFLATLDKRTSEVCGKLDGKVFDLADRQVGVNYPPTHPHCRSTVIPHFPQDENATRTARNKEGKNIHVPATMTYTEWKERYAS